MGSLMAGWNSPGLSSKRGGLDRTFSLTRQEIERFWRTRRLIEQLCALAERAWAEKQGLLSEDCGENDKELQKSLSEPADEKEEKTLTSEKLDWWRKSSSAFLNQPPLKTMEGTARDNYRYQSQYHIANAAECFLRSVL
eukprot:TRINITY_DN5722_c0_g1_i1.p1 TRINITY_DN5722_c0_g1~~TRINITY_DN5722_c0_g1_i1.p1  ORF type:complete len:139 (+),score=32.58 TRINITY_DN5722_c0_g1_i1:268-684(+)